ncbi:unnamed protein product [Hymenolepis diminuta]|uniref:Polyprotein n=1 Tax=Hymenolepis diminuta TaxID=6216 RepID=A0A0R3SD40_HYMDI|nr:unnamed protein product [Hymenolepis diminuta]
MVNEEEVRFLEQRGILKPISYSKWAAPIAVIVAVVVGVVVGAVVVVVVVIAVIRDVSGTIHLCTDYSGDLNDTLEPDCYPLPAPDDIFSMMDGGPGQPAASQPASKKALETHFRPTKPSYRIAEWLDGQFI